MVATKSKTTYTYSLTPTVGEYLFDGREKLNPSQIYGLTFSYNIISSEMLSSLGIDAVAGYIDTTSKIDNSAAKVYHFRVDAIYPFILKNSGFTPLFAAGAGGNFYERSTSSDKKVLLGYGIGLKYKLRDYLNVRADVRHIVLFTPERDNNLECTVGLTYIFGVERKSDLNEPDKDKKDKEGKKQGKKDIEGKEGRKTRTRGKIEDSSAIAKVEKSGGKESAEKVPETGKKPEGGESTVPAVAATTPPGTGQAKAPQAATAAKTESGSTTEGSGAQNIVGTTAAPVEAVSSAVPSSSSVTTQTPALQPSAVPTEGGAAVTATTATVKRAAAGKAPGAVKKLDGRNIAKPVEAVPPAAAVPALPSAGQMPAPESAAAPTEGEAAVTATAGTEERAAAEKAPVAGKKSAGRNIAKPVEAVPSSAAAARQPATVAKAEAAPAAVAARGVLPESKIVPPAAAAEPTVTVTAPAGETNRAITTPAAVAPSAPVAPVPAVAPVKAASAPAVKREVSPERTTVPPAAPVEPKVDATTPAGEAARETTTSIAVAPSAPASPPPATAPVEAVPAPVEKEVAKAAAAPAVPSPAYNAPPEMKRQLLEQPGKVTTETPTVVPTEEKAAVTPTTGAEARAATEKAPVTGTKSAGRNIAKPVEVVPSSAAIAPQSATVAKAEAALSAKAPSVPAPAAPAVAPVESPSAPAAAREVSPETKTVSPTAPAEPTVTVTAPAGEAAGEITAPVAAAPSKPAPPAPSIAPVEAAPAPVEKKAAKAAAEPAVPPPAYNAPPEEKRQLPEQAGKVTTETAAVVPTEGEAPVAASAGGEGRAAAEKAPVAGKKSTGRNIAKPVEAVTPSAVAARQPATVAKAEAAPAAVAPSAPARATQAAAPAEAAPVSAAALEVSPESKIVPPAAPAKPTVTVAAPAGKAARETTTPAAVAPSGPVTPAAPAVAPVKAASATVVTREVSPERTTVQPAAPVEPKVAATTPAGEAAGEITAPVAAAPSKPAPPAPATAPVEAAPAPVEKKAAKAAAEPAVLPPAYHAPSEEKRQLPEQPGKVTTEAAAVVPTEGGAALTAITGTGDGVEIRTNAPVGTFRQFRMSKPARLVIELPGTGNGTGKETFSLGRFGLAGARVSTCRGKLRIVLDAEGRTFPRFRVEKSAAGLRVALVEAAPPAQDAAPAPTETKQEYLLRFTIEFDTAKAVIRPKYSAMMRKAVDFLLTNPHTVAEIGGHTDSIGKARYNVLLSQHRAGSVRKFFVKKYGVDGARIIVRGFGYYFPIADNATAAGRQKNRRTEVTIAIRKSGAMPKPGSEGGRAPAPAGGETR